jgi:hypothetical protein
LSFSEDDFSSSEEDFSGLLQCPQMLMMDPERFVGRGSRDRRFAEQAHISTHRFQPMSADQLDRFRGGVQEVRLEREIHILEGLGDASGAPRCSAPAVAAVVFSSSRMVRSKRNQRPVGSEACGSVACLEASA